jgi:hypothetical protein
MSKLKGKTKETAHLHLLIKVRILWLSLTIEQAKHDLLDIKSPKLR